MLKPLCRTTGIVSQAQAFWSFVMQHLPSSGSFLLVMAAVGGKVGGSAGKKKAASFSFDRKLCKQSR
jgi:hypothetical protein